MSFRKHIILVFSLVFLCLGLSAQVSIPREKAGSGSFSTRSSSSERAKMIGSKIDVNSIPQSYGRYSDEKLEDLEKQMKEREWSSEETAWGRAVALDSKQAYERYMAMYPYGSHVSEANNRLIELRINDVMNSSHGSLPIMDRVFEDDDSPTSTIVIENDTGYPLTVMYSGTDAREITINPGCKGMVTLKNGYYKIAAAVPAGNIKPYAGKQELQGGRYETGFIIAPLYR